MSFDISKYREMFLEEAEELFESADNVLLEAENNGSLTDEEMGQLFRDVHTLKGSGASVELVFFAEFTHDVESLRDKLRNHKIEYIPEMAETLIDGLDVMKEILDLEVSNTLTREIFTSMTTALLQEIRAYSSGDTVKKEPIIEVKKSEVKKAIVKEEVTHNENFGFFDDDLNDQRDSSVKAYGIFADDDMDEEQKNYGFYDNDLEKLSNDIGDEPSVIDLDRENFGFFDEMPDINPDSVMQMNDDDEIEEKFEDEKQTRNIAPKEEVVARKQRPTAGEDGENETGGKKSVSNNNNRNY